MGKLHDYLHGLSFWNQVVLKIHNPQGVAVELLLMQDTPSNRSSKNPAMQGRDKAFIALKIPCSGVFTSDAVLDNDYILPSETYDLYIEDAKGHKKLISNPIRTQMVGTAHVRIEAAKEGGKPSVIVKQEDHWYFKVFEITHPQALVGVQLHRDTLKAQGVVQMRATQLEEANRAIQCETLPLAEKEVSTPSNQWLEPELTRAPHGYKPEPRSR